MTINETKNGNELVIAPEGRLDTTTAPELEEKVKELEAQLEAKEKVQTLPLNGFLNNIRNRFNSVFGTTAV